MRTAIEANDDGVVFLTSDQVRTRYGDVSAMWIERRLADASGFPPPIFIGRRRYWRQTELEAWERDLAVKSAAKKGARAA